MAAVLDQISPALRIRVDRDLYVDGLPTAKVGEWLGFERRTNPGVQRSVWSFLVKCS
jgi:hypothetical protein